METKKRMMTKKETKDNLRGVKITDDDLDEEVKKFDLKRTENYTVISDIQLSDSEVEFLKVHYKCRENVKLNKADIEVEVTKMGVKHRYEKMTQGDELEEMSETD